MKVVDKHLEEVIAKGIQDMVGDFITKVLAMMTQHIIGLTAERIEKMVKKMSQIWQRGRYKKRSSDFRREKRNREGEGCLNGLEGFWTMLQSPPGGGQMVPLLGGAWIFDEANED